MLDSRINGNKLVLPLAFLLVVCVLALGQAAPPVNDVCFGAEAIAPTVSFASRSSSVDLTNVPSALDGMEPRPVCYNQDVFRVFGLLTSPPWMESTK